MKQRFHVSLIFLFCTFLLLSYSSISARSLPQRQGEKEVKVNGIAHATTFKEIEEDINKLMGSDLEDCDDKNEECLKRRMIADAHLDYIYTQHHKP